MPILRSRLSRIIFLIGVAAAFVIFHFTNAVTPGGVDFSDLFKDFLTAPLGILLYLGFLFVPALLASILIPWLVKWVRSGT